MDGPTSIQPPLRADRRVGAVGGDAADDGGDDRHRPDLVWRGGGDVAAQDRDVAQRARRQVTSPGLVAKGIGRVQSDGPQALLRSQQTDP